ncbi:MAG: uroporphyrinogen decarboxylase family protein [Chloroflexota bacterium]|nr:uroporphyrinogen decarboxylase family protein [Chloroflexota bacterium]
MMESREIVERTLAYEGPERVAASFPAPYWNDLCHVHYDLAGFSRDWQQASPGRQEYVDEWGNTWARVDATSKGEVAEGVLEDWDDLDTLTLPDLADPANFRRVRVVCRDADNERFRVGGLPGFPFNIARKMRRLENFLMDILLNPDRVRELLGLIEDLLAETIVQYAEAGVDAVMFPEDWGTQDGLMIRPDTWRTIFKPGFARLCTVAHQQDIKVFMHSCGKITAIIPDLIEVGVDLLQFDQPQLHGIDNLARFHGQITFWCPVDIQKALQTRDEQVIVAQAREMLEKLGGPEGGFIAGYYGDNVSIGLEPRWQDLACRTFMRYGVYDGGK